MEYDADKVDEAVLALLTLTLGANNLCNCAWKGHDWDVMNRLHEKGLIHDPHNKSKSVTLTQEGMAQARILFHKLFGLPE
jgi:hypothetical protein